MDLTKLIECPKCGGTDDIKWRIDPPVEIALASYPYQKMHVLITCGCSHEWIYVVKNEDEESK
jgi:hypothetical protein